MSSLVRTAVHPRCKNEREEKLCHFVFGVNLIVDTSVSTIMYIMICIIVHNDSAYYKLGNAVTMHSNTCIH